MSGLFSDLHISAKIQFLYFPASCGIKYVYTEETDEEGTAETCI